MIPNFVRILNPGSFLTHTGRHAPVFVKVEYMEGRLAISGVEGPTCGGDALGGCGQIGVKGIVKPAEGWTTETITILGEIWNRWHLNDMRAGCEHQRAENWGADEIEVVTYKLTREAWKLRKDAEKEAIRAAGAGEVAQLDPVALACLGFDLSKACYQAPDSEGPLSGMMEVDKRKTERTGWVYPSQHSKGVLTKPCPVCGYKYGSAWLREEVPVDVVETLCNMPETTITPAWV